MTVVSVAEQAETNIPVPVESGADESTAGPRKPDHVARVGAAFLSVPAQGDDKTLYEALVSALRKDPRVRSIAAPTFEDAAPSRPPVAFTAPMGPGTLPALPHRHKHVMTLRSPLVFCVSSPSRLQGPEPDQVPAETYWVAWDGFILATLWAVDPKRRATGMAGGIVALEVLEEALTGLEASLDVRPCGPHCNYPFAHADLLLNKTADQAQPFEYARGPRRNKVLVTYSDKIADEASLVEDLFEDLDWVTHSFTFLRSEGSALQEAQERARKQLTDLLSLYYKRADVTATPRVWEFWKREAWHGLRLRWEMIGWRHESAKMIATLWLMLSTLDAKRYDWHVRRFSYDNSMQSDNRSLIFAIEYDREINAVEGLDVTALRSATEQAAARLDNRAIASATLAGAAAGGLVGAIATIVASLT